MTMDNFLINPSGFKSSSFFRRDIIIDNMNSRFYKLYSEKKKEFKYYIFKNKDNYVFYFIIPSEEIPNLVYDVVLEFIPNGNSKDETTIRNYNLNVFSNSLNFTFTYAYIYNKDGIIVNQLKNKISNTALTQAPIIKNQEEIYGFEKSVYFALLFIKNNNLNYKSNINKEINNNINFSSIKNNIKSSESKIKEYNELKKKFKLEQKEAKEANKKEKLKARDKAKRIQPQAKRVNKIKF